jgi:hypothetical protein
VYVLGLVEIKILRKVTFGVTQKKMVHLLARRHQEESKEPVIIV